MENETNSENTSSKKSVSPRVIAGIVVLLLIIAGAAYFMTKKGMKSSPSTAGNVYPTTSAMQKNTGAPNAMTSITPASGNNSQTVKSFEVDGSNFKFSPNKLTVNEGDTVKITFKNTQGFHNFKIDEFNASSKTIPANSTDELTFIANKKGTFQYYCGVGNHRAMGMVGTLTVK